MKKKGCKDNDKEFHEDESREITHSNKLNDSMKMNIHRGKKGKQ